MQVFISTGAGRAEKWDRIEAQRQVLKAFRPSRQR